MSDQIINEIPAELEGEEVEVKMEGTENVEVAPPNAIEKVEQEPKLQEEDLLVEEEDDTPIEDRNRDEETLMIDLKSIDKNEILSFKITKTIVKINVVFESQQIIALMDKNSELIDGNLDKEILVKDEWTFERKINYKNPNWTLLKISETK